MICLIIFLLILFAAGTLTIFFHLNKIFLSPEKASPPDFSIMFSIVIAAKNEEKNISSLINALQKINYPQEKFEVIISDDNSSDNTYNTALSLTAGSANFRVVKADRKEFPGKKGVLWTGISKAKNEFILITDADCLPENNWILNYSRKFREGFDFLFGIAPYISDRSIISKLSCFENLRSSLLGFSAASLGIPYTASARSLGFRKSSFNNVKGYSNVLETLSGDDDLLIREAFKNKMRIGEVTSEGSKVYSFTKSTLKDYIRQRSRHTKTSFYYLPVNKIFLSCWHLLNLIFLAAPLLAMLNLLFLLLFTAKISSDLFLTLKFQGKLGYKFNPAEVIYLQIFYEVSLVLIFFVSLIKKDRW